MDHFLENVSCFASRNERKNGIFFGRHLGVDPSRI